MFQKNDVSPENQNRSYQEFENTFELICHNTEIWDLQNYVLGFKFDL